MIDRAIKKRDKLSSFILKLELEEDLSKRLPTADSLTTDDWKILAEILAILEPVYRLTMESQGWGAGTEGGRLWGVLTGMEILLGHFESWKVLYDSDPAYLAERAASSNPQGPPGARSSPNGTPPGSPAARQFCHRPGRLSQLRSSRRAQFNEAALTSHARDEYLSPLRGEGMRRMEARGRASVRTSINSAWAKLDDYYTRLAASPFWTGAVLLNPNLGLRWLRRNWKDPAQQVWLTEAMDSLKAYFDCWYPDQDDPHRGGGLYNEGIIVEIETTAINLSLNLSFLTMKAAAPTSSRGTTASAPKESLTLFNGGSTTSSSSRS